MVKLIKTYRTEQYELTHYAFTTAKGTFTLSGSNADGTDEWKHVDEHTFHTWSRKQVYEWWKSGNIQPVIEATSIIWLISQNIPTKNKRE